ncbi:hypothetical protein QUB37_10460 [Microcoleus sp. AT3-A2]
MLKRFAIASDISPSPKSTRHSPTIMPTPKKLKLICSIKQQKPSVLKLGTATLVNMEC